ncbi:MAG: hypothetical protein DWI02_10540 [Planctomycetota bacterium]|nr:MAG: hypothetical protein DWI02_10540 [Planctomycetota bacterium]
MKQPRQLVFHSTATAYGRPRNELAADYRKTEIFGRRIHGSENAGESDRSPLNILLKNGDRHLALCFIEVDF